MKAEHRKELQTNVLADRMGRFLQHMKTSPQSTPVLVWVLLGLVVAVVAGWVYFSRTKPAPWGDLYAVNEAGGPDRDLKLEDFAKKHRGTPVARTARFQLARDSLREGQDGLAFQPKMAQESLARAAALYEELAPESTDDPLLAQEALMGVAEAEESQNHLERALEFYQKLHNAYPKSELGQKAGERAKQLEEELAQGDGPKLKFYRALYAKLKEEEKEGRRPLRLPPGHPPIGQPPIGHPPIGQPPLGQPPIGDVEP